MADNSIEIQRLAKELKRANSEISRMEHEYESRLRKELARIKNEFAQSTSMQQKDFTSRFMQLEKSLSDAYVFETKKMKEAYETLVEQVNSYEAELEAQIQQIVRDQKTFAIKKSAENSKVFSLAQESIERLNNKIQTASQYPVDLFYPHALQRYIDAGKEAEHLLQLELYSLALAKADCACMSVDRLTDDTSEKVRELESMFALYNVKLEAVKSFLSASDSRRLVEDNEIILELSEIDMDYWSDLLYSDLQVVLQKHQDIINLGVDGWLSNCEKNGISPSLQLDKEMQKLDGIPNKLNTCISYAISACDSYNYLEQIKNIADRVLIGQNYSYVSSKFGSAKTEITNGYKYYYDNWLVNEQCINESSKPDYREERVLIYEKKYADGKTDLCKIIVVPVRFNDTVSLEIYLQFDTDYLPATVSEKIRNLFHESGLSLKLLQKNSRLPVQSDRPLSLEVLNKLTSEYNESALTSKYSINL